MILEGELDTEAIKAILQGRQVVSPQDEERFQNRDLQKEQGYDENATEEEEQKKKDKERPFIPPSGGLDDE